MNMIVTLGRDGLDWDEIARRVGIGPRSVVAAWGRLSSRDDRAVRQQLRSEPSRIVDRRTPYPESDIFAAAVFEDDPRAARRDFRRLELPEPTFLLRAG